MNLVSAADFLSWAADCRIEPDARCAEPRCLTYVPHQNYARFWVCPEKPARLPAFLDSLLTGLDIWSHCYVWPRRGCWPYSSLHKSLGRPWQAFSSTGPVFRTNTPGLPASKQVKWGG